MKSISIQESLSLATEKLLKIGINSRDAEIVAWHLVDAERRGYPGHGLRRLVGIAGSVTAYTDATENNVIKELPGFVSFDAKGRLGVAAVEDALSHACRKAEETGAVVIGVTNFVGTTGSLAIFGARAAKLGCVSILFCNSEYAVAPHGSSRAILGTNPISVSMPTEDFPYTADFATAAWSYGAIKEAADKGNRIPTGIVQTEDGKPSTDPNDADNGSQLPMAGHKGYALGLSIELLAGAFLGAKAGRDAVRGSDGLFGVLIKADAARDIEGFYADTNSLFDEIKSSPKSGSDPIRIPGERANRDAAVAKKISLSSQTFQAISDI